MASAAVQTPRKLIMIEEYSLMDQPFTELVRGRIVSMPPPFPWHGYVCANGIFILRAFADARKCGIVVGNDSGVITERDPDTLRGADIAYYSYQRLPKGSSLKYYLSVSPDLIIEVRSPGDSWKKLLAKVAECLNADVRVVCVLDPENAQAIVYYPERPEVTLSADQELTFPEVLPGFAVKVGEFFE